MRHLIIINPAAGKRDMSEIIAEKAELAFKNRRADFTLYTTKRPRDAEEYVKKIALEGSPLRVYACGGDGTLSECVSGVAGFKNAAVTHFPCGTGNDFIKTFGAEAARFSDFSLLAAGQIRPLDIIRCNGRICINICSVGFDARVGVNVHRYRLPVLGSRAGYIISIIREFVRGINQPMNISCAKREFRGAAALVCACNGRYYGGGFNPVPSAMPDDGLLDFLVVPAVSRFQFLRLIGDFANGRYYRHPKQIAHMRGRDMTISSAEELIVNMDGELIRGRHIELSIIPRGVNFIFPKGMSSFAFRDENRSIFE